MNTFKNAFKQVWTLDGRKITTRALTHSPSEATLILLAKLSAQVDNPQDWDAGDLMVERFGEWRPASWYFAPADLVD